MISNPTLAAFEKARSGLWISLQAHIETVYSAERAFMKSVVFADSFPFSATSIDADTLSEYWKHWGALRDLYTDETIQLDTLVKAIRTKGYAEAEKKQLYLMVLGYTDLLASVVQLLDTHRPTTLLKSEELVETENKFDRLQKLLRFGIKGIHGVTLGKAA